MKKNSKKTSISRKTPKGGIKTAGKTKKLQEILRNVLQRIKPDEAGTNNRAAYFVRLIEEQLKKQGINAKVIIGGSIGKNTFLKGDHDVDLFVAFDCISHSNQDLSNLLEGLLKSINFEGELKGAILQRLHGSRDYFRVINELNFEIVPVFNIANPDDAKNITDCSPMHVSWVKSFAGKNPNISDEIRLVKAFCKSAGVYGAESYIKGFSGHVVDILTIYYGGFLNLLKASSKWKTKEKEVIDFYKIHKGKVLFELNQSKLQSPLIVIDPIQKNRNAAAALEKFKLEKFKERAAQFLKNPSEDFFVKRLLSIEEITKKAGKNKLIIIEAFPQEGKEDVAGAKLLKSFEYLKKSLIENDFKIFEADWLWNRKGKATFFFILDKKELPAIQTVQGPPVEMQKFADDFKKKHKKTFVKSGKLYAEEKREYSAPEPFVNLAIKNSYLKEKVKKIDVLKL